MVQKYSANRQFFSQPDVLNSYWAGFIAADGYIGHGTSDYVALHLKWNDIAHIQSFAHDTGATNPIALKDSSVMSVFYYDEWVQDLETHWNITTKKSHTLRGPNITDPTHVAAYVIGYIDGDGSWDWHRSASSRWAYLRLQIDGTKEICEWISQNLPEEGSVIFRNSRGSGHYLRYVGRSADLIDKYLMLVPVPRLRRKWWERTFRMDTQTEVWDVITHKVYKLDDPLLPKWIERK